MPITIRRANAADAAQCGTILYIAFQKLADDHNFARDFPSAEVATGLVSMLLANPRFYGIVAEENGRIVGSNFADHRLSIAGIGPISIDPEAQNQGIGRKLMEAAIDHFAATNVPGIRLVQAAYHKRSLCLYTKYQARLPDAGAAVGYARTGSQISRIRCEISHGLQSLVPPSAWIRP
jgi:predicted N-acetyltransferase YhbS